MLGRVIELQSTGIFLNSERGFLIINKESKISKIPILDLAAVIIYKNGITLTSNVLDKLQQAGVMVIFTDKTYHPASILYPVVSNYEQSGRIQQQIEITTPLKKQIWQAIVKQKINKQAQVLNYFNYENHDLIYLANNVKSGDTSNNEANAAKKYWSRLFNNFIRSNKDDDINSMLNYGYAILRSCVARYISATGLCPALGVFHKNKNNYFCLVDDLMEPFRPYVDLKIKQLTMQNYNKLTPNVKLLLTELLIMDIKTDIGTSPLSIVIKDFVYSYLKSIEQKNAKMLKLPATIIKE